MLITTMVITTIYRFPIFTLPSYLIFFRTFSFPKPFSSQILFLLPYVFISLIFSNIRFLFRSDPFKGLNYYPDLNSKWIRFLQGELIKKPKYERRDPDGERLSFGLAY